MTRACSDSFESERKALLRSLAEGPFRFLQNSHSQAMFRPLRTGPVLGELGKGGGKGGKGGGGLVGFVASLWVEG